MKHGVFVLTTGLSILTPLRTNFPYPWWTSCWMSWGHASWLSKLDLFSGFHQILMVPTDYEKTAFRTHNGYFEFRVILFGLCNSSSTFQATMNDLFSPHLHCFIIVFFDDIFVYSQTLSEHVSHLETTFQLFLSNCFRLKGSKCFIGHQSIRYLGDMVSNKSVQPDLEKLVAVRN